MGSDRQKQTPAAHTPATPTPHFLQTRPFDPQTSSALDHDLEQTSEPQKQTEPSEKFSLSKAPLFPSGTKLPSPPIGQNCVQAKLTMGQPGDPYEQEADQMATQVVQKMNLLKSSSPDSKIQRQEVKEDEESIQLKPMVQRQEQGAVSTELEASIQAAKGSGLSLNDDIRQPMEQAFGADFSGVKIHTDAQSDQLNRSIQAKAFTTGKDVFFRQGAYDPGSQGGQELLAHELTHVVQQGGAAVQRSPGLSLQPAAPGISRKPDGTTGRLEDSDLEGLTSFLKHNQLSAAWSTYPEIQAIYEKLKEANTQLLNQAGRSSKQKNKYREKVQGIYTRLVQETTEPPIQTWDAKAKGGSGAFVNSGGDYEPGNQTEEKNPQGAVIVPETNPMGYAKGAEVTAQTEGRNFRGVNSSAKARQQTINTLNQIATVNDIDQLDLKVIQSIDPKSIAIYRILHDVLHQSWLMAKEQLANPSEGDKVKRQGFMKKLWEYRQWHHGEVLQQTQKKVTEKTGNPKGLEKWPSAGSTTLTSDIDVNLKGERTEVAVEVFNELFKQGFPGGHSWDYEAGVVYDVNVYAVDFMHSFGGAETGEFVERFRQDKASDADENSPITDQVAVKRTVKEGKRSGQDRGGISDREFGKLDQENQSEAALVKVRLYMTGNQWEAYKSSMRLPPEQKNLWQNVEQRYNDYLNTMTNKIKQNAEVDLNSANQAEMTGMQVLKERTKQAAGKSGDEHVDAAKQEQLIIGSSNRIYEEKLKEVALTRVELKTLIATYNDLAKPEANATQKTLQDQEEKINLTLTFLRNIIAECGLYANEASITDAAVHHGVVGLQGGGKINMSQADALNAVNEHMGDALKEIERHGHDNNPNHLGEAIFKAAKYMWRMTDAAKNMGHGGLDEVERLYGVSRFIAEEIKGEGDVSEQERTSLTVFLDNGFAVKDPQALAQIVIRIGTRIGNAHHLMQKFNEQHADRLTQATPEKKTINSNM